MLYFSEDLPYDRRRRNIMRNTVFMVNQVGDGDGEPVPNWCGDCLGGENSLEMSDKD